MNRLFDVWEPAATL